MSWRRRLEALFGRRGTGRADRHAIVFYVRCDRCGEVIRVRADPRWDVVEELDDPTAPFALHKDVLGSRCNRRMVIHVAFDRDRRILRQEAEGARFVSADEYQAGAPPG